MMHLIIDGYNLIGIFHKDIEKARNNLLEMLINYNKTKNFNITVVFDAYRYGDKIERISYRDGIKIVFTKIGQTADEVIKSIISEMTKQWIVISSDREIAKYAWSKNAIPVSSEIFYDLLTKKLNDNSQIIVVEENKEVSFQKTPKYKRGNAHKLSKRQKAIERVLSKL
ncbi:MAG: NYN domain-containing protein [Thermodesulfovibrionales bacterium]|nr:NYN domain-containing protein [Thermodesulfovibrionales bacterium]